MLPYVQFPVAATRGMKPLQKLLMLTLLEHDGGNDGVVWPSLRSVKDKSGFALDTLQRGLCEMEELGYLTIEPRAIRGRGNRYRIADKFVVRRRSPPPPRPAPMMRGRPPRASRLWTLRPRSPSQDVPEPDVPAAGTSTAAIAGTRCTDFAGSACADPAVIDVLPGSTEEEQ
jgi:hypothetical protein